MKASLNIYVLSKGLRQIGVKMGEKFYTKKDLIERHHLLPQSHFDKTILVWFKEKDNLKKLLRIFAETAMFCYQYIDVGVYNPNDG